MTDLVVIVPSRGRPKNIVDLFQAWQETGAKADLCVAVDDNDPALAEYQAIRSEEWRLWVGPRKGMGPTLNHVAYTLRDEYLYLGFMGDDHRPRTTGWDARWSQALSELGTGLVYGNDLLVGPALPTAVAMTRDIVVALGGMVPAGMRHLFLDNFWKDLGDALGKLTYLPDVVIEHMHPVAGKAEMDETYAGAGMSSEVHFRDSALLEQYKDSGLFDRLVEVLR